MKVIRTEIPEVLVFQPEVHGDKRGYFLETYRHSTLAGHGITAPFVQDNQSRSRQGVLRGLHYQLQCPQGKLVRVISGRVFDVAVDIRSSSETFGRWAGVELSAENQHIFWVPPGFAHGFLVLSEMAEFVYKCTDYYAPEHERVIRFDDPDLAINWPFEPGVTAIVSDKDRAGSSLARAEVFP